MADNGYHVFPAHPSLVLTSPDVLLDKLYEHVCSGAPPLAFFGVPSDVPAENTWYKVISAMELMIREFLDPIGDASGIRVQLEILHSAISHRQVALLDFLEKFRCFFRSPTNISCARPLVGDVKLVLFDLNGVLCKKTKKKVPGAFRLPDAKYFVVPRPGYMELIDKLIKDGMKVGVYSSTPEKNAVHIVKGLELGEKLDFAWYRNHCLLAPDLGLHETRKSLWSVVNSPSVNVEDDGSQRFRVEECIICDDSPLKIEMNPLVCQFIVPSYADDIPEVPLSVVYDKLIEKIAKRGEEVLPKKISRATEKVKIVPSVPPITSASPSKPVPVVSPVKTTPTPPVPPSSTTPPEPPTPEATEPPKEPKKPKAPKVPKMSKIQEVLKAVKIQPVAAKPPEVTMVDEYL